VSEVLLVVEEVFDLGESRGDEARDEATTDRDAETDTEGGELNPALLRGGAAISQFGESALQRVLTLEG